MLSRAKAAGTGRRATGALDRVDVVLRVAPWVVLTAGATLAGLNLEPGGVVPAAVSVPTMGTVFLLLVLRLALAAARAGERRFPRLSLALALLLWAAGSAEVSSAPTVSTADVFPAPGEILFLSSYVALAAYLFLDVARRERPTAADWLEAVVTSGGAACLVALLVVTPFAEEFSRQGVPLLVALVYPVSDAVLLSVAIAQIVLRRRAVSTATVCLLGGLALLTVADTSGSVVNIGAGTYAYGLVAGLTWCAGFILVAESGARVRVEPGSPGTTSPAGARITVAAGAVALGVLVLAPSGVARPYLVVPAVVTFLAAGARLVLALREARGAAEAYRLSRTDELTGLDNRRAVITDLAARAATGEPLTVAMFDLDGFKEINDSLGHAAGDALLQILARRLRHALPEDVMAARLGGDEFAVVLGESDPDVVKELADDMRRLISRPIHLDGLEVTVQVSAGIAIRTEEVATKGDLLRCADVAMAQAKSTHAGVLVYDPDHDDFSRARLALAEELRRGLERSELVVWYQPQVDASSGAVTSVEALVRWKHPTQGLLAPFAFLPVARRAGLMPRLTEVVLETAMRDLAGWRARGLDVSVAVNVAPPELLGGTVLPELGAILQRQGVPADRLIVEVTEDSFLAEPGHARRVIHELRDQGIQVSIDDYGTGYSSLAYLRDLPAQELKIDRSFVMNILEDKRAWMIVNTTNQLAHGLGLRTVAEGVEDEGQLRELQAIGIDVLQGFHFARPMPGGQLETWLRERSRSAVPVSS